MESTSLKRMFLILDVVYGLCVPQWDSWGQEMGLCQSAVTHPGLPQRLIPFLFLLLG